MWTANSARVRDSGSGSGPSVHSNPTATERLAKGLQLQRDGHLEGKRPTSTLLTSMRRWVKALIDVGDIECSRIK